VNPLSSGNGLPALACRRFSFGPVTADPLQSPWPEILSVSLVETVTGQPPVQATSVKVGWDGDTLRILFSVVDDSIVANHTQRNAPLYEEEVVEVFLDPTGEEGAMAYFEIEVNPNNAVLDLVLRRIATGWRRDWAWECEGLQTAVQRHPHGWTAELAIPIASISALPPQRRWRVNLFRIDRPSEGPRELSAWSPTGVANFHRPERFGILELLD
jgi:hypothetical protein